MDWTDGPEVSPEVRAARLQALIEHVLTRGQYKV